MRLLGGSLRGASAGGKAINEQKDRVTSELERLGDMIRRAETVEKLQAERVDVTMPERRPAEAICIPSRAFRRAPDHCSLSIGIAQARRRKVQNTSA